MKPFTSFSSKPIVHKLGSLSPSISFHVSDRPFSCFTLHSRNEQKSSIFCLLKLVQNKGVCPLHVVPSEHQEVDLEPVESQVQQSEQTNDSKFVRVEFQLLKDCDFGEQFLIVGDDPKLGLWNPLDALPLTWSDGHIWTVELDMPAGKSILYKFILKGKEGDIIWQPGLDRVIQTWETMNRIIVLEDWENAELQKIIEEDTLSQTNEEPPVLPEVSTSTDIVSGIEETQIDTLEKLIDEPVLQQIIDDHDSNSSSIENPMSMFAENIGSSEDLTESKSQTTYKANVVQKSEESADGFQNGVQNKRVRYNVRREVALRMQRNKGRFTSAKSKNDESASAEMNCGTSEGLMADNDGSQQQDNVCRQCNISEKCTPMMRRGPEGPRTLCNACGLMWANKICRKNGRY